MTTGFFEIDDRHPPVARQTLLAWTSRRMTSPASATCQATRAPTRSNTRAEYPREKKFFSHPRAHTERGFDRGTR
jgi:hypothetical protein